MDSLPCLCAVLGRVRTVRLADCGLGASCAVELSKIFSDATAAVARVVLSGNAITDGDKDLCGLTALCEALPAAKNLTAIDFSNCGIKVKGVNEVAKATSAGAAVTKVDLRGNDFDSASMDALRSAAPQGCEVLFD